MYTYTYINIHILSKFCLENVFKVMDSKCSWLNNVSVRNM